MRTIFAAIVLVFMANCAKALSYQEERVNYKVEYRWGFINKMAGTGTVVTSCTPQGRFSGHLTGHSIPWGGRIYSVRDTLVANMTGRTASGLPAENVLHKNGLYFKPVVSEAANVNFRDASTFWSTDGRGMLDASDGTKEAVSITADMLSLFYYAKAIDFSRLTENSRIAIPITNADGTPSTLSIVYGGEQTVNVGGLDVPAYAIVFNYTYMGQPSAYPVHCWIGRDTRIPLIMSASLLIGHMEMIADL